MKIDDVYYAVAGEALSKKLCRDVPLFDIPMMSDKRWNELVAEQKAKHGDSYKAKALE